MVIGKVRKNKKVEKKTVINMTWLEIFLALKPGMKRWGYITALRGPDNTEPTDIVKLLTTAVLRGNSDRGCGTNINDTQKKLVIIDDDFLDEAEEKLSAMDVHFRLHVISALNILAYYEFISQDIADAFANQDYKRYILLLQEFFLGKFDCGGRQNVYTTAP